MNKKIVKLTAIGAVLALILFYIAGTIFPPSISERRINEALEFCKKNNLSTEYAVFVDFSIHSGRERYMIYSFSQHKVVYRCLCTGLNIGEYSNRQNSNLSYLGKYRIRKWSHKILVGKGERILADGLERTYSNAKNKVILIYDSRLLDVFPKSLFPIPIIGEGNSHGCFSITAKGVEKTKELRKPTLLWAYK
jgi:hypothetical protein